MADILKTIEDELPRGVVKSMLFEGANIVVYTDDVPFLKEGDGDIRAVVNKIKKRVELRADGKILMDKDQAEKEIRSIISEEAELTQIIFDIPRSIVIIEAKRPGIVIGKSGSILKEIKDVTHWSPIVQRSPSIKSKITENIRAALYLNNNHRRKFLNEIGEKIYADWDPSKMDMWVRMTALGGGRQVGRSAFLLQTPKSKILIDCGIDVSVQGSDKFPYLDIPEFNIDTIDAVVLSHAHLDHVGLLPYLYKMGYKGPVYMTTPSRDIAALLSLDFIGVSYKQATTPLFSSSDVTEMVKHTICLDYNEVTDITPDIRITMYNAGHTLGSAMIHFNIGNGLHNFVYSGDHKYGRTRLLDPANTYFPRVETLMMESTYGGRDNISPPRREVEEDLIQFANKVVSRGGKLLIPELGLGRSQETMLILEDAMRNGKLENVPIYIDGMIWDINAIHTAYPDFLSRNVKAEIYQDRNPFTSEIFKQIGSAQERKSVIEGGPCIVLATSGMLVGGASVEYLREFADNEKNGISFVCYQPPSGLGGQLQSGNLTEAKFDVNGKQEIVPIRLEVRTIEGFSGHSYRNELMSFVSSINPKPKKILINHGEISRSLDLGSSIYKSFKIETILPRNLETIRFR